VPGQEKRQYSCVRLCPVTGEGSMNSAERKRRAMEIVFENGANSQQRFKEAEAVNRSVTFREQAKWWLIHMQSRKRKPVKPATIRSWSHCLNKRIYRHLGDAPLSDVTNRAVKGFVEKLAGENLSAKTIRTYVQTVKMVVASAVDDNGDQLYPRKWNHDFMDLPEIKNAHAPSFTAEQVTKIVSSASGWHRTLYALLAGSGLRIGEVLGLEIGKHLSADCMVLTISQSVWEGKVQRPKTDNAFREVDLEPSLASLLKQHVGERTSGFLFASYGGRPVASQSSILKHHLHPLLSAIGCEKSGFHSFRRFRVTHLRKSRVPEDLLRFWIGHADKSITDSYSRVKEDVAFRQLCAANVGLGFDLSAPLTPIEKVVSHGGTEPTKSAVARSCTKNEEVAVAA
jgi:integrase